MAIETRHKQGCAASSGRRCGCKPSHRAAFYFTEDARKRSVKGQWHADRGLAERDLRVFATQHADGQSMANDRRNVAEYWATFQEGMLDGSILSASGTEFRPSCKRGYPSGMRHVLPHLGHMRLVDVQTSTIQTLVDQLRPTMSAASVRNAIKPLRAMYRHARQRGVVNHNPTEGLSFPALTRKIIDPIRPAVAAEMIAALPERDRGIWAMAFYAGLRIGEIRGLLWEDVDLEANVIRVAHGYDDVMGRQDPKTSSGVRVVPLIGLLRPFLLAQRLRSAGSVVFTEPRGQKAYDSFNVSSLYDRATAAWEGRFERITPHDARHTFVSVLIDAGLDVKKISRWAGHSDVAFTMNTYGHLFADAASNDAEVINAAFEQAS